MVGDQIHASAAKAAIDSVTRSLGLEWGTYNIRVNGIAPGPIADTPGMTKLSPGLKFYSKMRWTHEITQFVSQFNNATLVNTDDDSDSIVIEAIPLRRMGKKWDIAMTAVFLCSSAGSFISYVFFWNQISIDSGHWLCFLCFLKTLEEKLSLWMVRLGYSLFQFFQERWLMKHLALLRVKVEVNCDDKILI
jgi:2,4-dienoyl-CoA reductase [(3E)-enoyl-CoA-producing], peroxisomal